jgi:hypothetical protein
MRKPSTLKSATLISLILSECVVAHEHHEDNIPDGKAISPDPLVGEKFLRTKAGLLTHFRTPYYGFIYSSKSWPSG